MIRIANRIADGIDDYFIYAHNRGKLVDEADWNEFNEAKEIYKAALIRFAAKYHSKKE